MAFFLPSSASTSTTTSSSSSPLPVIHPLDSDDESERSHDDHGNESLRHHQSNDIPTTQSGFTILGLLSRRIDYISGASASDISSLEESSESEGESSSWTRRATIGDDRDAPSTRMSRSTREDARSPSRRRRQSPDIPVPEPPIAGTSESYGVRVHQMTSASEPNVVPSRNQIEEEETVKSRRRRRTHEVDRHARRQVKTRHRRDSPVFEGVICTFQTFYGLILFLLNSLPIDSTRFFPYCNSMFWIGLCVDGTYSTDNDELVCK